MITRLSPQGTRLRRANITPYVARRSAHKDAATPGRGPCHAQCPPTGGHGSQGGRCGPRPYPPNPYPCVLPIFCPVVCNNIGAPRNPAEPPTPSMTYVSDARACTRASLYSKAPVSRANITAAAQIAAARTVWRDTYNRPSRPTNASLPQWRPACRQQHWQILLMISEQAA